MERMLATPADAEIILKLYELRTEAVMRQANTLVLRQKLADAKGEAQRGDIVGAAKLYQEACALAESIGSGIPEETTEAVAGLTSNRLALARDGCIRRLNDHSGELQCRNPGCRFVRCQQ